MTPTEELSHIPETIAQLRSRIQDNALKGPIEALRESAENAARAWSGSNLGYHAVVYYAGLQPKPPGVLFSAEWGLEERWPVHVPDRGWQIMDKKAVIDEIISRAGGHDPRKFEALLEPIRADFDTIKQTVISVLSVILDEASDTFLQNKLQEIEKLIAPEPHFIAMRFLPKGQLMTRDSHALAQGLHVAPHQSVLALPWSADITEDAIEALDKAVRLSVNHLQRHERVVRDARQPEIANTWDSYDVMQVCQNGHQITAFADSQPQSRQDFCEKCGAETIDSCPSCENKIRGYRNIPRVIGFPDTPVPKYCIKCGTAYPWQQSSIDNLAEILRASELSPQDVEIIETALPYVLHDTPKTESSSLKVKRVLGKLGKPLYDISVKVITDIASETAKKTLGLPM